jgi:hypothetical protein
LEQEGKSMTQLPVRASLAVLLASIVLVAVSCSHSSPSSSSSPGTTASAAPGKEAAAPNDAKSAHHDGAEGALSRSGKLFANWPTPKAVLVISGQMDGYLEPCGCTQGQIGGLIRRADFLDRLKAQNWPVALVDLGSLIKDPGAARGGFEQAKIKFGIALKAYSALNYQAIALSAEDLKVGIGEAFAQFLNNLGDSTRIVAANVQPAAGFESRIATSQIIQAGPLKIGVTAVVDPEALSRLVDPDKKDLLPSIKRPDEVLGGVLANLQSQCDYQVLLVQGPPELAKRLATAYPGLDVVVATSEFTDVLESEPLTLNGGKTMVVSVGRRGKCVGAVGFFPDDTQKMRFHLVTLISRFDGPGAAVKHVIEDEYRDMLKAAGTVENFPRHDYSAGTAGARFVGAETCRCCHPNTVMKWSTTKHAQAFVTLRKDPKPNTVFDAECVTCHTTGFEYTTGFRSEAATPQLMGNQCENCHGPASKHAEAPDNPEIRAALKITAEQANKNRLCIRCHDEDNSPKFEFASYWSQIVHNGLDDYKNPAVHGGGSPKVARTKGAEAEK